MSYIMNHPGRFITGLTTVLAAAGVAVGSGATFTASSANPTNTFTAGTLTQSNSKNGTAIVTGTNMKPGDVKSGEVTIKNTGSLAGDFTLTESDRSNAFTAGKLKLKIVKKSAPTVALYEGDFGAVTPNPIVLEKFDPAEENTYVFTVTLDATAGNVDQGKSATATYTWDATQSPD